MNNISKLKIKSGNLVLIINSNGSVSIKTTDYYKKAGYTVKSMNKLFGIRDMVNENGLMSRKTDKNINKLPFNLLYGLVIAKSLSKDNFPKILEVSMKYLEENSIICSKWIEANTSGANFFNWSEDTLKFIKDSTKLDVKFFIQYLKNNLDYELPLVIVKEGIVEFKKSEMLKYEQNPVFSEAYLSARGFKVLHLHRDSKRDYGDETGYIISISEKNDKVYLHILEVCCYNDLKHYCLEESDILNESFVPDYKIFDTVEDVQAYLDKLVIFMANGFEQFDYFLEDNSLYNISKLNEDKHKETVEDYKDIGLIDIDMLRFAFTMRLPFEEYMENEKEAINNLSKIPYKPNYDITEFRKEEIESILEYLDEDEDLDDEDKTKLKKAKLEERLNSFRLVIMP